MTRYGLVLPESVTPDLESTPCAYDAFAKRSRMPDIAVLFCREWRIDPRLVAVLRDRGMEVVCYVTQREPVIDVDVVRRFAADVGDGTAVRLNQEMDGDWGAGWQAWEEPTFVAHWSACRQILRSEADIRVWWCPSSPRRAAEAGYWPGEADLVGFDRYAGGKPPAALFAGPIRQCRDLSPGTWIWVGETGIKADELNRARWLRSLADVEGVDVIVIMNLVAGQPRGGSDDWRWSPSMERAFRGMVA